MGISLAQNLKNPGFAASRNDCSIARSVVPIRRDVQFQGLGRESGAAVLLVERVMLLTLELLSCREDFVSAVAQVVTYLPVMPMDG
jgi:hypothetical protein